MLGHTLGRKDQLKLIYERHFDDLYRYLSRLAPDESLVKDCIHQVFMQLYTGKQEIAEIRSVESYLYVSARRLLFRLLSNERKQIALDESSYDFKCEIDIEERLISSEIDQEKKERLQRAIVALSARQREIIYLKFYQELSYEEIGSIMELNYQSARNLTSRALKKLADILAVFIALFIIKVASQ